jgi:hypothetical protein
MVRPFSERVAGADWRRDVEAWVTEQVERHGHRVNGPIEQPRIRPWSTQLTIPTDAGPMWFKANCQTMGFEPRLHAELARLAPDAVDEPCAIDAERGWMLTLDRGTTLGASHEPTLDDWSQVLAEAARMQRVLADHRAELLATGLPDCAPSTVVDRYDRVLDTFAGLPDRLPSYLPPELASRLRTRRPMIVDAAQELAGSPLPATLQHGDLHPWNVFAVGASALRVFDFGDAQWAHAVELLSVPFGWITSRTSLKWADVLDAYCEVWNVEAIDLDSQWRAAGLTQPVNRAVTWWGALTEATAAEWGEWGDAPVHHLSRVLDP